MNGEYEIGKCKLICGDCLEVLRTIPDKSINLVLTDPPYNGKNVTSCNNRTVRFDWDYRDDYIDWCIEWLNECQRVLTGNGVLYFWHNDMEQIAELLEAIRARTSLAFISFCIWDKGDTYRAKSWKNRDPDSDTSLRSWFQVCEYCLHFFNAPREANAAWNKTGLDRINSNPECYKPLKEWYWSEMERLNLTEADVAEKYTEVTGKKPHMLRHYFHGSQFEIPTREIWDAVYKPLGFRKEYEELRKEYEELRKEYEELRKEYEELRNYHRCDRMHCNIWHMPPIPSTGRFHTCQKPVEILERLVRVSCPDGGVVLDCFAGSASTAIACMNTGREFIGIEKDPKTFETAKGRIEEHYSTMPEKSPIEQIIRGKQMTLDEYFSAGRSME